MSNIHVDLTQQFKTPFTQGPVSQNTTATPFAEGLCDRYADSIIANFPYRYNGIEIHGVRDLENGTGIDGQTCFEPNNIHPQFYSVYLHIRAGGGIECVGDLATYSQAKAYALELSARYDWPIADGIQEQFARYAARQLITVAPDDLLDSFPLSNGRTVFRMRAKNGSKEAFLMDRSWLTPEESEELTRLIRRVKTELN